MKKYKIVFNGEEEDDVFDTEEQAEYYALYLESCCETGAEILNLSNPGDYPLDDCIDCEWEIIEVDE